jgi:hypothetical protein
LIGTDFADYFTEPQKAREGYQIAFSDGLVKDYPLTIRHRNELLTDVLYNASVYRDAIGNVLGVFAAAWELRQWPEARKAFLVGVSYIFYACWDWRFTVLLAASSLINYTAGRLLAVTESDRGRRQLVAIAIALNLGILAFFKYFGFFMETLSDLLTLHYLTHVQASHLRRLAPAQVAEQAFLSQCQSCKILACHKILPLPTCFWPTSASFLPCVVRLGHGAALPSRTLA